MALSIAALRAVGNRPVTLTTTGGSFTGSIVTDNLSERSVMLEFEQAGDADGRIVIPVDDITNVAER